MVIFTIQPPCNYKVDSLGKRGTDTHRFNGKLSFGSYSAAPLPMTTICTYKLAFQCTCIYNLYNAPPALEQASLPLPRREFLK
jgi:hypothetical protein